jgi:hypothetical protein
METDVITGTPSPSLTSAQESPNSNMWKYLIIFLILAIFLDDTREFGIRDEVFKFISNDSASLEKPFSQFKNHSKSESKYKSKISKFINGTNKVQFWAN